MKSERKWKRLFGDRSQWFEASGVDRSAQAQLHRLTVCAPEERRTYGT